MERRELAQILLHQRAIAGGGGEESRGLLFGDGVGEDIEARLVTNRGRGAGACRKHHPGAEAEGEREGRGTDEDVSGLRLQDVARHRLSHCSDVAMEMNAAFWCACGAGGERDERGVIGGCRNRGAIVWRLGHALREIVGRDDELQHRSE